MSSPKSKLLHLLGYVANKLPLASLLGLSQQRFFAPFYHLIDTETPAHIKHLYAVRSPQIFEQDLDYLLKKFSPISLEQLITHKTNGTPLPKNAFWLSFDDGLRQCYDIIKPILERKGIPATFFINSAFVDNKALMFRYKASLLINFLEKEANVDKRIAPYFQKRNIPYTTLKPSLLKINWQHQELLDELAIHSGLDFSAFLQAYQPYMTSTQIQEMLDAGFTIGSHSVDHPTYYKISETNQLSQTINSQQYLNEKFELDYKVFAFPFSDFKVKNSFFKKILNEENFNLTFGGAGLKKELIARNIQRFPMETQDIPSARRLVQTEYLYYILKRLFGKHIRRRD
ncbi:MAG: polysaccharide deacetylase family protein [Aureispira sp.]|nr:polysaccharide deacetylase family protein [Aureispira sp.]